MSDKRQNVESMIYGEENSGSRPDTSLMAFWKD